MGVLVECRGCGDVFEAERPPRGRVPLHHDDACRQAARRRRQLEELATDVVQLARSATDEALCAALAEIGAGPLLRVRGILSANSGQRLRHELCTPDATRGGAVVGALHKEAPRCRE